MTDDDELAAAIEADRLDLDPAAFDMATYRRWRRGELDPADLERDGDEVDLGTLDMPAYRRARGR